MVVCRLFNGEFVVSSMSEWDPILRGIVFQSARMAFKLALDEVCDVRTMCLIVDVVDHAFFCERCELMADAYKS